MTRTMTSAIKHLSVRDERKALHEIRTNHDLKPTDKLKSIPRFSCGQFAISYLAGASSKRRRRRAETKPPPHVNVSLTVTFD